MKNFSSMIKELNKSGFISIIFSSTLVKVIVFASSLFLPRFLSTNDFGIYSYTENLFNYFLLLNGAGISNAVFKYCANNESNEIHKGYFLSCIKCGVIFDIILTLCMLLFCYIFRFQFPESKRLMLMLVVLPLFLFLFECIQFYLRSHFENNKYSILTFIYSFLLLVLQIILVIYCSLNGIIFAKYLSIVLSLIVGIYFLYKINFFEIQAIKPDAKKIYEFIKYGVIMLFNNFTSLIISLNDTYFIGAILKSPTTLAVYKVASLPLQLMLFFTNAIIIFILPHFIKNSKDKKWTRVNFKKVMILNLLLCIIIHVAMFLLAKPVVLFLYGEQYIAAVKLMNNFLIVSFVLSSIRNIPGNLLAVLGYEKFNLSVNIFSVLIHLILNFVLLTKFGISSIGIALFVSYLTSGVISLWKVMQVTKEI